MPLIYPAPACAFPNAFLSASYRTPVRPAGSAPIPVVRAAIFAALENAGVQCHDDGQAGGRTIACEFSRHGSTKAPLFHPLIGPLGDV